MNQLPEEPKHQDTIRKIREAFANANFTKRRLDDILEEILEEVYWKGVEDQRR